MIQPARTDKTSQASEAEQAAEAEAKEEEEDVVRDVAKPFSHGHLRHILSNPLYIGKLRHKDRIYEGRHEAIIDPDLFDQVQALLSGKVSSDRSKRADRDIHLLTGLVFDETGDRLSPSSWNVEPPQPIRSTAA